ncbi:hypothetical protein B0H16DRAFT_1454562 [Mycena metata]|uniref:Uncharacterized protein n=1 Tax=Mycena metata TaxID=1033252 RepID=A0AAD7NKX9_9AGAR|nr:hypothetical protein B0H16DRAFT_1454562 [Mycena metata]
MKSSTSASAKSRFRPYYPPIPLRPSVMTTRNGARLRAAGLVRDAALNDWLAERISSRSLSEPDWELLNFHNALCVVHMSVIKGAPEGIFKDPDVYCLSLHIEAKGCSPSPLLRLARFVGSSGDGDAPLWTQIIQPNKSHYLVEPRSFAATLTCGLSNIPAVSISSGHISARMYHFARQVSLGTHVERDVGMHCRLHEPKKTPAEKKWRQDSEELDSYSTTIFNSYGSTFKTFFRTTSNYCMN